MIARRAYLLVVLSLLGVARDAWAVDVPVRAWAHSDFGRLVFDWPVSVGFSASIANRQLAVRFDRPIATSFDSARANLSDYIGRAAISPDGRVARIQLKGNFRLRSFKNDNAIVIDLLRSANREAAPELGIRIGEHPTFTRFVFDWNSAVDYSAAVNGRRLSVRFDRPARIDLAAVRRDLPPGLANPAADALDKGIAFTVDVPRDARLRHFRSGTKIVVDVLAKPEAPQTAEAAAPPPAPDTAPAIPEPDAAKAKEPAVPEKPAVTASAAAETPAAAEPPAAEKPAAPVAQAEPAPSPADNAPRRLLPGAPPQQPAGEDATPAQAAASGKAPQAGKEASPAVPERGDAQAKKLVQDAFAAAKEEVAANGAPDTAVSLVFEWPQAVGAAVFDRAGYTWVVFDRRTPIDLAPLRSAGKGLVSRMEQLPIANATVLRMVPKDGLTPFAHRDGTNWVIDFRKGRIHPDIEIPIEVHTGGDEGSQLVFPAVDIGSVFNIPDPEVGDLIKVATIQASSQGIAGNRAYPEFQILASTQGIAVVPLSDDLELAKNEAGLTLQQPGGLHVSGVSPDSGEGNGNVKLGRARRIFQVSKWMQGPLHDYYDLREKLQDAAARLPRDRRNPARMKLAEFYFARTLSPEAKGVLQVVESQDERVATQPEFKALRGAVAILNHNVNEAARDLDDPRLDKYEEVQLWRGMVAAAKRNWKQATLYFKSGEAVLYGYPEPMKTRVALVAIDAALRARDPGSAGRWLNAIQKSTDHMTRAQLATMHYLQGRLAFAKRDLNRAQEMWNTVKKSGDLKNSVRAELSLINLGLLQDTLPVKDAIARLEKLRFEWRGDEFELEVLRRLGGLYLDQKDYRKGLGIYRVIATYFPHNPDTPRIAKIMTDTFKKLYLDGEADKMPPLKALALYDEFRELTPAGEDGNIMIQKLAQRLVDVDLLTRAADLLQHQVKYRLQGEERASVGAKLALIRLLDKDPVAAIDALRMTAYSRLPEELANDRRRIHARALFETGHTQQALELLAGDVSRNADLLRADIQWRSENWPEAAKALQRLAGQPPSEGTTYDRAEAQVILNWAVALRLANDESGLAVLRELYGKAMEASPLANAFQFISSPSPTDGPLDIQTITSRVAETDMFDKFLKEYLDDNKKRLLKAPEKAKPAPAAPATPQAANPAGQPPASG